MYAKVKLSDSLYNAQAHLNLTHKKDVGILQFARIGDKRGDYEKRVAKLKEFKHPQDDALAEIFKTNNNFNFGRRKHNQANSQSHEVGFKQQFSRHNPKSNYLPVHMQNMNGRIALSSNTYNSLKANNFKERPFLDPVSTLNSRKDFHINAMQRNRNTKPGTGGEIKQKKKNLTFNQLLSKFGYI